ncbi:chorismate mutase [Streptomyces sp. NBC_00151]|uniref:chorismate mutase n=1 Tax=Streptomyces sp. NBC_00151 TaxID=2975669 RepID=UPI003FA38DD0
MDETHTKLLEQVSAAVRAAAGATEQPQTITELRKCIDDLDDVIVGLVRLRINASAEVQRARLASGGRRLSLSREMEILARYKEALGSQGTRVAMELLELCRGPAPALAFNSSKERRS